MLTAKCDDVCDFCSAEVPKAQLREWGDWMICPTCHAAEWAAEEREQEPRWWREWVDYCLRTVESHRAIATLCRAERLTWSAGMERAGDAAAREALRALAHEQMVTPDELRWSRDAMAAKFYPLRPSHTAPLRELAKVVVNSHSRTWRREDMAANGVELALRMFEATVSAVERFALAAEKVVSK